MAAGTSNEDLFTKLRASLLALFAAIFFADCCLQEKEIIVLNAIVNIITFIVKTF
jgi:hypothetical protein